MQQFLINNWHLILGVVVVTLLLVGGPLTRLYYGIRNIPVGESVLLMNHESAVVVDVREPTEFSEGHIHGAINIPLGQLTKRLAELERYRERPVVVNCRSGQRSSRGAVLLRKHGFARVYNLAGGILAWQGESLPTEK